MASANAEQAQEQEIQPGGFKVNEFTGGSCRTQLLAFMRDSEGAAVDGAMKGNAQNEVDDTDFGVRITRGRRVGLVPVEDSAEEAYDFYIGADKCGVLMRQPSKKGHKFIAGATNRPIDDDKTKLPVGTRIVGWDAKRGGGLAKKGGRFTLHLEWAQEGGAFDDTDEEVSY